MTEPITSPESNKVLRASIWVAIGALIAAAIVCVIWVIVGDSDGIVAKAFLTIVLLAGFAGVSIMEANLAARRPAWLTLASMVSWVLLLLIGAFLIWMPTNTWYAGGDRIFKFVLISLIIQGALLHARLYLRAFLRHQTTFTTIVTYVTIGLVVILAVMLVLPIMTEEFVDYRPLYWRVVVALAILAAVGTALVPLVNALFAPKKPRPVNPTAYGAAPVLQWPTYADGATPLPVLPDGSPDWNAYYTGQPTYPQAPAPAAAQPPAAAPSAQPPASAPGPAAAPGGQPPASAPGAPTPAETAPQSGYQGFPPPPPLPPQG
ncbi:MAG: hypothetical protein IE924_13290 [Microbacterium sp.]|jgi:hypothetical protein|uniref:hypothetical protein n=1 Tax=Microbacterium TaxID=33882 RepID=UPI0019BB13D3|nr:MULTISPECIES: hypothetical protein [Microbacterium]MBD3759008.1 hypothetical protein [Microbacterium sp.]